MSSHNLYAKLKEVLLPASETLKFLQIPGVGYLLGAGADVSTEVNTWAPGAVFIHVDGTGVATTYRNEGTYAAPSFVQLASVSAQTFTGLLTLAAGLSSTTGLFSGLVTMGTAGFTWPVQSVTATADGTGTGTIANKGFLQFVAVTAKTGDANGICLLPDASVGSVIIGYVGATGFELRSHSCNTVYINGGKDTAAESAIAANMLFLVIRTSATTWHGLTITGTTLAAMEAAAN